MASAAEHREKGRHNNRFLATIADDFPDWLATVAFYVAAQYVESVLAGKGIHSTDHDDRKQFVRRHIPEIQQAYNDLFNASLVARYDALNCCMPLDKVRERLIAYRLKHLVEVVERKYPV